MTNRRTTRSTIIFAIAAAACASGQDAPSDSAAGLPQVALRVTGARVNVRSRPDTDGVVVMQVERGAALTSVGGLPGWQRVRPPDGLFCCAAAEFIKPLGENDGEVAVRSGTLRVRAGSLLHSVDPLRSDVLALLPPGARVRILGREGDWFRIAPPEGATVCIAEKFVETVSGEPLPKGNADPPMIPAAPPASPSPLVSPPPVAVVAPVRQHITGEDLSAPWGQQLLQVENAIAAESVRPSTEQQWNTILAQLRRIAGQVDEPAAARLAAAWSARVTRRSAELIDALAVQSIAKQDSADRRKFEQELERIQRSRSAAPSSAPPPETGRTREGP